MKLPTALSAVAAIALLLPTGPAEAGQTSKVRVVNHNIAGGALFDGDPKALNPVNRQIRNHDIDIVMLQEVCASQSDAFWHANPGWSSDFTPMRSEHPQCESGALGLVLASPHRITNVELTELPHPAYSRQQYLLCGDVRVDRTTVRACVTHVMPKWAEEGVGPNGRRDQVQVIADTARPAVRSGMPVIVGGDFNAPRKSGIMAPMRAEFVDPARSKRNGIEFTWHANTSNHKARIVSKTRSDHQLIRTTATLR